MWKVVKRGGRVANEVNLRKKKKKRRENKKKKGWDFKMGFTGVGEIFG